jgi:hypothetical protein
MSANPPPVIPLNYSMSPAPRPLSKAAIVSLVLGLPLCIPLFTGIPAAIFGVIGLGQTRDGLIRGRGMAIAGLVLGLINICLWGIIGVVAAILFKGSAVPRQTAHDWLYDLSTSQPAPLQALTGATYSLPDLANLQTEISGWGPLASLTSSSIHLTNNNGQETCDLSGIVTFTTSPPTTHTFTMTLDKEGGSWKVIKCEISHP